jgi:RNA polymerase sigma factor (sigma-70 family)
VDTNSEDSRPIPAPIDPRRLDSLSGRVRGAVAGSHDDVSWVVEQLSPLMVSWAQMQMGPSSRLLFEPEDIVHDVWVRTLPALSELHAHPEDGRMSSGLLALLRTALLHRIVDIRRQDLVRRTRALSTTSLGANERPTSSSGPVQKAVRGDQHQHVLTALTEIPRRDRELYVRKIFEGLRLSELAAEYGMTRDAVIKVRQRVRKRLEGLLTSKLLDDLEDD